LRVGKCDVYFSQPPKGYALYESCGGINLVDVPHPNTGMGVCEFTSSLCSAYTYYVGGAALERSKYVVYTYNVSGAALERSKYVVYTYYVGGAALERSKYVVYTYYVCKYVV